MEARVEIPRMSQEVIENGSQMDDKVGFSPAPSVSVENAMA